MAKKEGPMKFRVVAGEVLGHAPGSVFELEDRTMAARLVESGHLEAVDANEKVVDVDPVELLPPVAPPRGEPRKRDATVDQALADRTR